MLWHGTTMENLESIKTRGLTCAGEPGLGATKEYRDPCDALGCVCLTSDPKKAAFYGVVTTVMTRKRPREDVLIVAVDADRLEEAKFVWRPPSEGRRVPLEGDYIDTIPPELLRFYRWDPELKTYVLLE